MTFAVFEKNRTVHVSDGTAIAYAELGHGDRVPVVLVNGWSCSDVYWTDIAPHLIGRGHRVLLPDARGHGESGLPRPPGIGARNITARDMSLERIAADLLEVCGDADVTDAVFVGHSMGVQVILEVYREAPARVRGLVAVAGPYENPMKTFAGTAAMHHLFPVAQFAVMLMPELMLPAYRSMIDRPRFGTWGAKTLRAAGPKITSERFAPYLAHLASRNPQVLFKLLASMRDHSAEDLLPRIDVPFLILAGEKDTFCPPSSQRRMHDLAPGSELVWFPEGHHTLPLEEPEGINAALDTFLDRLDAPGEEAAPAPKPRRRRAKTA
jgi:pimeloyl-ACP methyl ester carboxylesterase